MKWLAKMLMLVTLAGMTAQARVAEFSRYEVILSRRPFGEPSAVVGPGTDEPKPVPTGPSFADSLKLVALTYSQGDVRVGFVDSNAKPPKTYFLFVGESENGIEVVSASYDDERVVLRKGGDERTLSMASGGSVVRTARTATPVDRPSAGIDSRPVVPVVSRNPVPRVLSPGRQLRLEEERRRAETIPDLHGQVLEKHLQEYNMQAIREGAPPLPIPLTPEQDAQLVEEGVLPPVE